MGVFGTLNTVRELQGLPLLDMPLDADGIGYLPTPIPCTGVNRFLGTLPEIDTFETNATPVVIGQPPVLAPGVHLLLTWAVANVDAVVTQRTSAGGPPLPASAAGASGTRDLGAFSENRPMVATYELRATNRCGTVTRETSVALRAQPHLHVLGVEVAQTVQQFDVLGGGPRNTVPLVSRHRTVARVYLDSGLTGSFTFGSQPGLLPVTSAPMHVNTPAGVRIVQPLNPGVEAALAEAALAAESAGNSARLEALASGTKALNYLLPWDVLDGLVTLSVSVQSADGGSGTTSAGSTTVLFRPRRRFRVIFVPVMDTLRNLPTPSRAEFVNIWRGAMSRLPLSEDHWTAYWYTWPLSMDYDLADDDGFGSASNPDFKAALNGLRFAPY
jgi:hypothetical protein